MCWGIQKTSQSAGWMFFNGDMPWLKSDTIGKLLEYADAAHIVVPRYGSRPGQPVYFARLLLKQNYWLDRRPWRTDHHTQSSGSESGYVPIDNIRQGVDVDTPEGYEKVKGGDWVE